MADFFIRIFISPFYKASSIPRPYGTFHLLFASAGSLAAALLAYALSLRVRKKHGNREAIVAAAGLILAAGELYKQAFLFIAVNQARYDWWYFPFQLCSVPMYLALLLLPLSRLTHAKKGPGIQILPGILCTFIQDYGFLGGLMALAVPDGLMHPFPILTFHGFMWHFFLLFMALFCAFTGLSMSGQAGFFRTIPLFFLCCFIAEAINILAHPYGNADMFYITPYRPTTQPVFHEIALAIGNLPAIILYLASILMGAFLAHIFLEKLTGFLKRKGFLP